MRSTQHQSHSLIARTLSGIFTLQKIVMSKNAQTKQGRKIALLEMQSKLVVRLKSAFRKALTIPHKNPQKLFHKSFFYWIF